MLVKKYTDTTTINKSEALKIVRNGQKIGRILYRYRHASCPISKLLESLFSKEMLCMN